MITILGSHGEIQCHPTTGDAALPKTADAIQAYGDIIRFDLAEWKQHYGQAPEGVIDICDIGYWTADLSYEPPVKEHREAMASGWGSMTISAANGPAIGKMFGAKQ